MQMDHVITTLGQFYDRYGYLLVFGGTFLENVSLTGLLLPGGALAFIGAFYARQGTLSLPWVMVVASLAALAGCHVDYATGRWLLARLMGNWQETWWGERLELSRRIAVGKAILDHVGGIALAIGPFTGVLRSFIIISAGAAAMPYGRFVRWMAPAVVLWNIIWCLLGYWLGTEYALVRRLVATLGWGIVGVVILMIIAWRIGGKRFRSWLNRYLGVPDMPLPHKTVYRQNQR